MTKHIIIDRTTGEIIKSEDMPADMDPEEFLRQQMHDCPECRAAMALGEQPIVARPRLFPRRPRWRTRKRRPS